MAFKDLFRSKPRYVTVDLSTKKKEIPEALWTKCPICGQMLYAKELANNLYICMKCSYHFRIDAKSRISQLVDEGTFIEFDAELQSKNPLNFKGYEEKLSKAQKVSGLKDAMISGEGMIYGRPAVIGVIDFNFMGGSMGSVVGEKVVRSIERSIEKELPLIIVSGGGGGARMQEGILSLMQMAKTSAAVARLSEARLLYISILTDPTMGGIFASFASLGDINIAEPGAVIGFAGPRVIEQTREKLPTGFQTAEFLLEHGMIDMVVHRKNLKKTLKKILEFHPKNHCVEDIDSHGLPSPNALK